jgi:hypothetical protein
MRLKTPDRRKKHFCECDPPFHIGSGETMKSAFSQLAMTIHPPDVQSAISRVWVNLIMRGRLVAPRSA